jgi:hypothetical protein
LLEKGSEPKKTVKDMHYGSNEELDNVGSSLGVPIAPAARGSVVARRPSFMPGGKPEAKNKPAKKLNEVETFLSKKKSASCIF